jgi:NAD(P)-dependent dehydrogenase (short-subunit alcohol dehydrogenase family)
MRLEGKVAVVTGAARGVGAAIAVALAKAGAAIIAVDILQAPLEASTAQLCAGGFRATPFIGDISTEDANETAVGLACELYGGLDCFVANAAIQRFAKLADTLIADWDAVQNVNLRGAYLGCKAALPRLVERGGGSLILTASVLGIVGDGDLAAYGAAKGGLRAMCRSMAVAYGPKNVRCNTICPGDVRTELFEEYIQRSSDPESAMREIIQSYPLRRIAEPADIGNAAVFLASEEGTYINGTDLIIDGGLLASVY